MKRNLWLVLVLLMVPALVLAQAQTTGRINGRVTDESGAPLPGATVTVNNQSLQLERTTTTGQNGDFLFALLPTGNYEVTVAAEGRQPEVYRFRLELGQTVPVNAQLAPGQVVSEEITVTGVATALETTTIGENFDYETEVESLPITARDIESVATLSPNISFGPTGGTLSISGAPSFDTTVMLDGAEVSDPYFGSAPDLYLEDAVEEVQVLTSGVSARYGRFQGGIINAITKSGSNEFEGTLRAELENEDWDSSTPFDEVREDDLQETYQATLGGYIVKDRLWFFVGGRTIPETVTSRTATGTREAFSTTFNEDRWQAKLRSALSENHLVDLSYLSFDSESLNSPGLTAGEARAVGHRTDPRETFTASYQGVLGSNTFLEIQATQKNVEINSGGDPAKGDPFIEYFTNTVYNNGWWDFTDPSVRDNETAAANLTHSLSTENLGSHTLEGGIQFVRSTTGGENRQSSTGYNLLALNTGRFYTGQVNGTPRYSFETGYMYRWLAVPLGGDQVLDNYGAYLQDGWTLNKWRFDLGVRYDQYDGTGPLPQFNLEFDDISPRVGVTYSFTPSWQVQATYGRYISRFNDNVANNATGVANAPRIEHIYTGPDLQNLTADQVSQILRDNQFWTSVTAYIDPTQPTTFLANDINAPYADDYNLSLRHALPRNSGSVVLSYIRRDYEDLLDDFIGLVCTNQGLCDAQDTTSVVAPGGGAAFPLDTTVWANNPNAERQYRALTAVFDLRPTSRWAVSGNYTYAKTEGNYEGEAGNQPSSGSNLGNYPLSVIDSSPFGYTDDDIRHRVNLLGTYSFDFNRAGALTLGSIVYYQSGRAWSRVATRPYTPTPGYISGGNPPGTFSRFFGERGSERFNDWWQLDLSARYELPIFSDFNVFLKAAVTNVLNNDELRAFQTTGTTVLNSDGTRSWAPAGTCGLDDEPNRNCSSFGRIRNELDYQPPRQVQLTVAFDF
jgi:outer membrane receptor protein involved in Fe transport